MASLLRNLAAAALVLALGSFVTVSVIAPAHANGCGIDPNGAP